MINSKIAILYSTFLRDDLMYKTVQSIIDNWKHYYVLLIADQGNKTEKKNDFYKSIEQGNIFHWYLPYNCGISYSRNFLIDKATESHYEFCLLSADSIEFTSLYYFNHYLEFLKNNKNAGIVGFDLENRIPWECYIKKTNTFELYPSEIYVDYNYLRLKQIDICRNFFLAKTEVFNQVRWDESLKASEHEDFFYRLKKETDYKVYYSPLIQAKYINFPHPEYDKIRKENFIIGRKLAMQKWNLNGLFRVKEK